MTIGLNPGVPFRSASVRWLPKPAVLGLCLTALLLSDANSKAAESASADFFVTVPPAAIRQSLTPQEIEAARGNQESRPAAQDPEGHWGGTTEGFQLSVRFDQESFRVGEPIVARVIIRNVSGRKIFYPDFIALKEDSPVCQFDVLDEQSQPAPRLDRKAPRDITDGPHLPRALDPGTQCRYEAKLETKFKLDQPGTYTIRARRWVHHLEGDGYSQLQSGQATIKILKAAPGKSASNADAKAPPPPSP